MNRSFFRLVNISKQRTPGRCLSSVAIRPLTIHSTFSVLHRAASESRSSVLHVLNNPHIGFSQSWRNFCTPADGWEDLTFKQVTEMLESKNIQLFDVREPKELEEVGKIGGAINVPLREVEEAFALSPSGFSARYGAPLPSRDDSNIVLTCLGGVRSRRSLDMLHQLGYKRARHYLGGFEDWVEKGAPIAKQ